MGKWDESYSYVPSGTTTIELFKMPLHSLVKAHQLIEEDGALFDDSGDSVSTEKGMGHFRNLCWVILLRPLNTPYPDSIQVGAQVIPGRMQLIQTALWAQIASWCAQVQLRTGAEPVKDWAKFIDDSSYLWSYSQWDGFPGDSYEILGIDPEDWTLDQLAANHGRSVMERLDAYDLGDLDIEVNIERAWLAAVRGELREALEFLRRAESDLLTTSWPDYQEPDDHSHQLLYTWSTNKGLPAEWSRMIGEIRTFIYDLLPDPTQSALVRVERSELAISATMEATVRRIQDSMLTIGSMVVADIAQRDSDSTESINRRLDAISDRLPMASDVAELQHQFARNQRLLLRSYAEDIEEMSRRLAVTLDYWGRMDALSQQDIVTAETFFSKVAGMDEGMLSPACIGIGYARACEREKEVSGAWLAEEMYEELTSLRNDAAHAKEFTVDHLIRLRQLALESVLPILTKKGGL